MPSNEKGASGPKVDLSQGVDLSHLRTPKPHVHRWVVLGRYQMDDETMEAIDRQRQAFAATVARGEEPDPEKDPPVKFPMVEETLVWLDGPGCGKCGVHMDHNDSGYGHGCPVSDEEYEQALGQQFQQLMHWRREQFLAVVEKAKKDVNTKAKAEAD